MLDFLSFGSLFALLILCENMPPHGKKYPIRDLVRQSPPLDTSNIPDDKWVKDKTILITGAASGFGAAFTRKWALAGATIIAGDINVQRGDQLVSNVRKESNNPNIHFVRCDVTEWQSQVNLFKEAVKLSPHGGIDAVIANAGVGNDEGKFENPKNLDIREPPPPNLMVLNVNLTGVLYTAHLAFFYLPRNPGSRSADPKCDLSNTHRDRHLLLMGSCAGILPLPGQGLYAASKHAVVGLYRSLRSLSFVHGIRVNLLCPWWIDTPIINTGGRVLLAGESMGTVADVVEAATRFTADPRVVGRAVVVGPKLKVRQDEDCEWIIAEGNTVGDEKSVWEVYPQDFEDTDVLARRLVGLVNRTVELRGWIGWTTDIVKAISYGFRAWWIG